MVLKLATMYHKTIIGIYRKFKHDLLITLKIYFKWKILLMDKANFTSHLILLSKIKKSLSKDMGEDITILELSYILNQTINPLMAVIHKDKLEKINTFELDPIEVLKKRKNLKILKILNLILTINLDKTIKTDDIEHYIEYNEKFLDNIATIGLDRLEQEALKVQIGNLLKYNWAY